MTRSASQVLEQEFLQVRAKILEIGAFFDRLSEAPASAVDDGKLDLLQQSCRLLVDDEVDKAARIQMVFSREYDEAWREKFGV